jgi:hypothetical protein
MLEAIKEILDEPWKPVSRPVLMAWLLFYAGFLVYAFTANGAMWRVSKNWNWGTLMT